MSNERRPSKLFGTSILVLVSVFLSIVWAGVAVALAIVGQLWTKELNVIGDFLAGWFAPLAFYWLVLGFFRHGEELELTRLEARLLREQIELQSTIAKEDLSLKERSILEARLKERLETFPAALSDILEGYRKFNARLESWSQSRSEVLALKAGGVTYSSSLAEAMEAIDPVEAKLELRQFIASVSNFKSENSASPWSAVASIDLEFAEAILQIIEDFKRHAKEIRQLSEKLQTDDWNRLFDRWSLDLVMIAAAVIARHRSHTFSYY